MYIHGQVKEIGLSMELNQDALEFSYSFDGGDFIKTGGKLDASILSDEHAQGWAYTGAVVGITAVDTFNKDTDALFREFYQSGGR